MKVVAIPYVVWMAIFVVAPLILVVVYAFTNRDGSFTLENFCTMTQYASVFGTVLPAGLCEPPWCASSSATPWPTSGQGGAVCARWP